jgi:predicted nuclease with TOPRIM domain
MIRLRFAIRRRFALKDLLIATAVIALALAWRLDRNQLAGQIESLSIEVKSGQAEIQFLTAERGQLREMVELNRTQLREVRLNLRSLTRDLEELNHEIDLETLVSGVDAIETRGNRLDGTVFVTFSNGKNFFRRADTREASRAQRLLIRTRMR